AVFAEDRLEPRKTPCCQSRDWGTNGTLVARRPPKRIAEMGTRLGSCHSGAIDGHCDAGTVNRALGCAAGVVLSGVHACPCQSVRRGGLVGVISSHHTSPSGVSATLVKMAFPHIVSIALLFVLSEVPGATPKNPASGLIAYSR